LCREGRLHNGTEASSARNQERPWLLLRKSKLVKRMRQMRMRPRPSCPIRIAAAVARRQRALKRAAPSTLS
jgi:hypothetical protein